MSLAFVVIPASVYGYVAAVFVVSLLRRWSFWLDGSFSFPKFYGLMGWVPLCFVLLAALVDVHYLAFFIAAAVAGIGGELLVSVAYHRFLGAPIWTYSYGARSRGYTSTLNVLPWAFGGLLFQQLGSLARMVAPARIPTWEIVGISAAALVLGCLLFWPLRRFTVAAEGRFSVGAFALFCAPIGVVALAVGALAGPEQALLMVLFSPLGFATEYTYGRIMSFFFAQPLWRYTHLPIDDGHTSFVTLPLWALGGLYFHLIAQLVGV